MEYVLAIAVQLGYEPVVVLGEVLEANGALVDGHLVLRWVVPSRALRQKQPDHGEPLDPLAIDCNLVALPLHYKERQVAAQEQDDDQDQYDEGESEPEHGSDQVP